MPQLPCACSTQLHTPVVVRLLQPAAGHLSCWSPSTAAAVTVLPLLQLLPEPCHWRPGAHLKSPHTFKLSWLPFSMYTAPPALRACTSKSRSSRRMPAGDTTTGHTGKGGAVSCKAPRTYAESLCNLAFS
jgi:hypothetical protein